MLFQAQNNKIDQSSIFKYGMKTKEYKRLTKERYFQITNENIILFLLTKHKHSFYTLEYRIFHILNNKK